MTPVDGARVELPAVRRTWPDGLEVSFLKPAPWLSVNQRVHWTRRFQHDRAWQGAAYVAAFRLGPAPSDRRQPPSLVELVLPVHDRRNRDPHNYSGTTLKAVVDGLVKCGLWPDDGPAFVRTLEPRFELTARGDDACRVILRPLSSAL